MKSIVPFLISIIASTSCLGQNFTNEYIEEHKGKWSIEIPEVQELVHIIIAITPTGLADSNMVEHRTQYYKEVLEHFKKYDDKKIVDIINTDLRNKGLYFRLKMDACGFFFGETGNIIKDKTYEQLNWDSENYISPYLAALEQFATETGFRKFFKEHKAYYDNLVELMQKQMPIDNQWKWLENNFPIKYNNYRITFSPLVNGSHSTNRFETRNFKQTVMFICGPMDESLYTEKIREGLMTKVVFTEIDHNYVNLISDRYKHQINEIFKDRKKWTAGKDAIHYENPYSVFNEYMTWAVFTLYALDVYSADDFKIINERTETQMANWRGFSKFKEFNQKLIELSKNKKSNQSIADLYPAILDWCKNE